MDTRRSCLIEPAGVTIRQMKSITLQLSDDLEEQLNRFSQREHRAVEDAAREIIRRRLAIDRFQELCSQTQQLARAAGYTSEDQLLDEIS